MVECTIEFCELQSIFTDLKYSSSSRNMWMAYSHTSNTMQISDLIFSFSRLCAWAKLRGYPFRIHPFSLASCCDNRAVTICKMKCSCPLTYNKRDGKRKKRWWSCHTAVTISSGTKRPEFMYSFALFPISVPADNSALRRSPVDICTKPNWRTKRKES